MVSFSLNRKILTLNPGKLSGFLFFWPGDKYTVANVIENACVYFCVYHKKKAHTFKM